MIEFIIFMFLLFSIVLGVGIFINFGWLGILVYIIILIWSGVLGCKKV